MPNALPDAPKQDKIEQEWEEWFGQVTRLVRVYQASINPSNVGANSGANDTLTVAGLSTQDAVYVHATSALTAGLSIANAFVSAKNTLTIQWANATGTGINMGAITVRIIAIKPIQ